MTLAAVGVTTLQFNGPDSTSAQLRRLVQDLVNVEKALNTIISLENATTTPVDTVPPHVLATTVGLDADHTVSGLTVGQVLKAISETNAAFSKLQFSDLEGSDITDSPENGDFIQYVDGFWVAAPTTPGSASGINIGGGKEIYASTTGAVLQFRTLLTLGSLTLSQLANAIVLDIATQPDQTFLGNDSGATAIPGALTMAQATAMLLAFTTLTQGLVPPPGSVNGFFLRDDGTWDAATSQVILSAGWNSSSGAIPISLTVPQDVLIPNNCTLQEVYISTQGGTGSCTVTLTTAAFPGPPSTDITGGVSPAISGAVSYANTSLLGWTIAFLQGAMIRATLTANTTFTSVKIMLRFK